MTKTKNHRIWCIEMKKIYTDEQSCKNYLLMALNGEMISLTLMKRLSKLWWKLTRIHTWSRCWVSKNIHDSHCELPFLPERMEI